MGWKVEEEWRFAPKKNLNKPQEYNGYEKWKETAFLFVELERKFPDQFYLLSYKSLLTRKKSVVSDLFDFCDLKMTSETLDFLKSSSQKNDLDAYSVFKKKDNDDGWKDELPNFIIEEIMGDKEFQELNKIFRWI